MARFILSRRSVLRGIGGVALPLPALEMMGGSRRAGAAVGGLPTRYVVCYGGLSTGGYTAPFDYITPKATGPDYELTRGLDPIGKLGMKSNVGVVSGLKIPWATGGSTPPGGRLPNFHGQTMVPLLSGMKVGASNSDHPSGSTSDQIVADGFSAAGGATIHKSIAFRVQPSGYEVGYSTGNEGILSWAKGDAKQPIVSPTQAYQSVFGGGAGMSTEAQKLALTAFLDRRKSILDFVRGDTQRLVARLGGEDKQRLQKHFDEISALETRIVKLKQTGQNASCKFPPPPPADPPIGASIDTITPVVTETNGYSNEELRAEILCRFVALAFACNLTRVASVLLTLRQCGMNTYPLFGKLTSLHGMSHYGGGIGDAGPLADAMAWHVKHFTTLAAALRDTPEVDGSSILDHTVMVMGFEGGQGRDPEQDPDDKEYNTGLHSPHSTENMLMIIAGGAGGMKSGQHVRFQNDRHPAQVLYTAMQAVGINDPLGDISTPLPELMR